ncbi:MAG TPA: helix-hairpin-helix domain-containing protein [Planctomycetota bacterium]
MVTPVLAPRDNEAVAQSLLEIAERLEAQDANPFRVQAYRRAAETVRGLGRPVVELLAEQGAAGLEALPGIGAALARAIEQLARTGRLALLERLRSGHGDADAYSTVPGIGPKLAARIRDRLGIESLADLEVAAWDGRLQKVPGMGRGRVRGVRESLAGRFRRGPAGPESARRGPRPDDPPVGELLDVDAEYRRRAREHTLPRIVPRRFNPSHRAWLPVLHTQRQDRHYTALFSNTARAHELGATHDWVVIYRDGDDQWTVVTAGLGPLRGRRIVRGRERECEEHYAAHVAPEQDGPATS